MKCFYHSADLDGKCSAAIVRYCYPECECVPINYGEVLPWPMLERLELVFVVDFSFAPEDMEYLNEHTELVWIDHHAPKIAEMRARGFAALGGSCLADDDPAACELVWKHLLPGVDMPEAVRLLGRYDAWDRSDEAAWAGRIVPFQYGMRAAPNGPDELLWRLLFSGGHEAAHLVERLIQDGHAVRNYQVQTDAHVVQAAGFETELAGHATLAVNQLFGGSELFLTHPRYEEAELLVNFCYDGKPGWRVSLSPGPAAPELDCAALAVRYGGGGHPGRAGFCCATLPFDLQGAAVAAGKRTRVLELTEAILAALLLIPNNCGAKDLLAAAIGVPARPLARRGGVQYFGSRGAVVEG